MIRFPVSLSLGPSEVIALRWSIQCGLDMSAAAGRSPEFSSAADRESNRVLATNLRRLLRHLPEVPT